MNKIYLKLIEISEKPLKTSHVVNGKYQIVEMLGKGSYGFTYLVKDQVNKIFVLKQLRKYKMLEKTGLIAFRREAAILSTLKDPAFPTFYEHFEDHQKHFIVMEYKAGSTFEELIFKENQTFSESRAFQELYHILLLVGKIHEKGYVHRDLRIPNILKNKEDYYIIDFGLARSINEKNNGTEEKITEQEKRFYREIAYKSDFYALGHFLLFLLYSSYEPVSKKKRSWEEELAISPNARKVLRKMLQIEEAYDGINQLINDVKECI